MTGTCISERTRRGQEEDDERIDERLKGKYEVWKFGLGPSQWRDAGGGRGWFVDVPFRVLAGRSDVHAYVDVASKAFPHSDRHQAA